MDYFIEILIEILEGRYITIPSFQDRKLRHGMIKQLCKVVQPMILGIYEFRDLE